MRLFLLFVAVILAAGCAKHYWVKSGGTTEQFQKDNFGCARQALGQEESAGIGGAGGAFLGGYYKGQRINETVYRLCMNERGYTRHNLFERPPDGWRGVTDEL